MPNDMHPPHNISYGDALVAAVYNALRGGPKWKKTLLIITFDEHGGCYDHVVPPAATSPGGQTPNGFLFDYFGVRVPAVIVSPWVPKGSVIRPPGLTPFDHTSIIATLRKLFPFAPLTARDAAAPDLVSAISVLNGHGDNDGPVSISAPKIVPTDAELATAAASKPNDMQKALSTGALLLPTAGADVAAHAERLAAVPDTPPQHPTVAQAVKDVVAHVAAFLGRW
jgi:phospholipase C